jgi:hypothetical protein
MSSGLTKTSETSNNQQLLKEIRGKRLQKGVKSMIDTFLMLRYISKLKFIDNENVICQDL